MRSGRGVLLCAAQRCPGLRALVPAMAPSQPRRPASALLQQTRGIHPAHILRDAATPNPAASAAAAAANSSGVSALDVAMRVNKLKRLHQTGGGPSGKRQIELDAWGELNSLTEEQINAAEGKSVSLLLNSWAYFAKFWEKGKDGPLSATRAPTTEDGSDSRAAAAAEKTPSQP